MITRTRTFEDVVERLLAGGFSVRPQTSADLDSNEPPTVVVGRIAPDPAGSPAPGGSFVLLDHAESSGRVVGAAAFRGGRAHTSAAA